MNNPSGCTWLDHGDWFEWLKLLFKYNCKNVLIQIVLVNKQYIFKGLIKATIHVI